MKEQITGTEAPVARRRRLPRCIRGDRILTPFAVGPALGLALLHNSGVGPLSSLVKGAGTPLSLLPGSSSDGSSGSGDGVGDAYEAHQTLPMGNVAVITNCRLLMLSAPEFAVLEAEVLSGRRTHVRGWLAGWLGGGSVLACLLAGPASHVCHTVNSSPALCAWPQIPRQSVACKVRG
jgi:hypothetical protein